MKNLLLASFTGFVVASGSAFAADLPLKAPPPPPPSVSWTGCYIDGGVGYGMWNQDHYLETNPGLVPITSSTTNGGRGWMGRVGAGCDVQASRFVFGAFADYDFMNLNGTNEPPDLLFGGISMSGTEKQSGAWGVGARVGYLITPGLLTYFNAGYTEARFDQVNFYTTLLPTAPTGLSMPATTYHGWFIGGGEEYALGFLPSVFWRTEYRYAQYQAVDVPIVVTATGAPTGFGENNTKYTQTITTGLVWRFNWGGPVVSRY